MDVDEDIDVAMEPGGELAKDSRKRVARGYSSAHMKTTALVYKAFADGQYANDNHEIANTLRNYRYEENRNLVGQGGLKL
jgi:hypothetical protein